MRIRALALAAVLAFSGPASAQLMTQLTKNGSMLNDQWGVLSEDGQYLGFVGERNFAYEVFSMDLASAQPKQLTTAAQVDAPWALAISGDGAWLAYIAAKNVWILPRTGGTPTSVTGFTGTVGANAQGISMSYDGKLIGFTTYDTATKIYDYQVVNTATSSLVNLSKNTTPSDLCTGWISGDGTRAVFACKRGAAGGGLWIANPDGTGVRQIVSLMAGDVLHPRIDKHAGRCAFESNNIGPFEIYVVQADGTGLVNVSKNSGGADRRVWLSADGERVIWKSRRNNQSDAYIAMPDGSGLRPITTFGGVFPDNPNDSLTVSGDGSVVVFCSRYNVNGGNPEADWELYLWKDGLSRTGRAVPGGAISLDVTDPTRPAATYLLRCAFGRTPGIGLPGVGIVPLNPDALFWLSGAVPALFQNFGGTLNANGLGGGGVALPKNPALRGVVFYAGAVTVLGTVKIMNPLRVEIE